MIYDLLAPIYDEVNSEIDYVKWADFFERLIDTYGEDNPKPKLVLDLGCGTGKMTLELAKRGYDMTGVDISAEMLDMAEKRANELSFSGKILWLLQDMRSFELYGTVDLCVSTLDSINHLTSKKDLEKTLSLVHNYLIPNGLFIFDINGKAKFEKIYKDNSYVYENQGSVCVWQNYYNEKTKICDFLITVFDEEKDGRYARYDELEREKMYTLRQMKSYLLNCGFEFVAAFSNFEMNSACDDDERIYIVAKCKKTM
jgi:SAM-dependent methyltransferase